MQKIEMNLVQPVILKKIKKIYTFTSYTVKSRSKGKKNIAVLSISRLLRGKTISNIKEKPQIIKSYGFNKGRTDIVDQMNDYYIIRAKSCPWLMVVLFYLLEISRVNGKTI